MKKVAVIGGGLAGLSAAVYLAANNFTVHLYEASPKPGGRASSFLFKQTNEYIDCGQHLMLGCYDYTLDFVKKIGAMESLYIQDNLSLNFIEKNNIKYKFDASTLLYPFNLLLALAGYKAMNRSEKLGIIKLLIKLLFYPTDLLSDYSVREWLVKENQSERVQKVLWQIFAIGALNSDIEKCSAKIFADILKQIFLRNNKSTVVILPQENLNNTFHFPAKEFIIQNNGQVHFSTRINDIQIENDEAKGVIINDKRFEYDFVISAVPFDSLFKIVPPDYHSKLSIPSFRYSSILNVHLWLNENIFNEKFYGLLNSDVHWIFNHGSYVSITISDANRWMEIDNEKIVSDISFRLKEYFPQFSLNSIEYSKVIKEKRATFVPEKAILKIRPSAKTKIKNLYLAGDWTNTGLPATIEGAIKSGKLAATEILRQV
ncbi:MAG: FAD-dependent oxidoreductase [Ignavibacteriales bacterium]|nr:MAG: FAD-dependent oxidoreductase [Ignavibacteriales bacterium]